MVWLGEISRLCCLTATCYHFYIMTRQQRYQRRHKEAGLCIYCPRKAVSQWFCEIHLCKRRTIMRARKGSRPWYPGGPGRPPLKRSC